MTEGDKKPAVLPPSPFQGEGWGEGHPRNLKLVKIAKKLRRQLTDVETILWRHLRGRELENRKFRRQYPIGKYVVDFLCAEKRLIIELDGGQHNREIERDYIRDSWLAANGYRILRFWNHELIENLEGVLQTISAALQEPSPFPLPKRERVSPDEKRDV